MIKKNILDIKNLQVKINETIILNNLNLSINSGEIHAIMGKNGSGKSTLAKVIAGHPKYKITQGQIIFNEKNITEMEPEERAHNGIFLAFQYPVEIPGVSNADFLRTAYNAKKKFYNENELDPLSFLDFIDEKIKDIDMDVTFLNRNVNEGFSGGEKKKNEILQMSLLNSQLSLLDETDSGLDIDALKTISHTINNLKNNDNAIILITHYQRLLDYIKPNYVHIMQEGNIVHTGDFRIVKHLEQHGYQYIQSSIN
uniref:iron-sulfur cluster formation ABC transporter ATP-binding subunit n=1 Tax=Campylaephora boydenii TaxID=202204 RepID=UPI002551E6AD|nr:iron-sulfur cluster formation ABC transporter ATP-binding subunit [Campylaephora boydenii]WGT74094.1 iron-sulfur cluster formation ABC transporter ATP-binding subunit [Campylaephora boydenii]